MKDLKFTPGPWQQSYFVDKAMYNRMSKEWKEANSRLELRTVRGRGIVGDGGCNIICVCTDPQDVPIISKAPEMYELLKQMKEAFEPFEKMAHAFLDDNDFKGNRTVYAFDGTEIDYDSFRKTLKVIEAYNKLFEE